MRIEAYIKELDNGYIAEFWQNMHKHSKYFETMPDALEYLVDMLADLQNQFLEKLEAE